MATKAEALAKLKALRKQIDIVIEKMVNNTEIINDMPDAIKSWKQGVYKVGDVRMYNGTPRKCHMAHDSTNNPTYTPDVASLWIEYHGTSPETARPYIAPTGAHDMYLVGEYMIYTDGKTYKCLQDTSYSPTDYARAWEVVE